MWLGSIALFPQGIVPLGIKLSGAGERIWFLALYLPDVWQWLVIGIMILLGLLLYRLSYRIYRYSRPAAPSETHESKTA